MAVAGPPGRAWSCRQAIIRTGKRAVAILRSADGRFEPREVALGADFGDDVEIVSGLAAGDQVVASGQFLIDSEARLRSVLGNIASAAPPAPQASAQLAQAAPAALVHEGEGRVERVSADTLTISHGPIATLKWPAMTMGFAKPRANAFPDIKPGDRVRFRFREGGASGYELVEVTKLSAGAAK